MQADLQQRGAQAHIGDPQTNPDGFLLLLVPYRDRAGQSWTAVYAVASRPDGAQFCSMVSNLPPQEMKTHVRSGASIFGETVKQARLGQSPSPQTRPPAMVSPLRSLEPAFSHQKSRAYSMKAAV
jgi:hypothetical protein